MFGIGGFTLWDFIVVGWQHVWSRVRRRFPGAPPDEIVRYEDIRSFKSEVTGGDPDKGTVEVTHTIGYRRR